MLAKLTPMGASWIQFFLDPGLRRGDGSCESYKSLL